MLLDSHSGAIVVAEVPSYYCHTTISTILYEMSHVDKSIEHSTRFSWKLRSTLSTLSSVIQHTITWMSSQTHKSSFIVFMVSMRCCRGYQDKIPSFCLYHGRDQILLSWLSRLSVVRVLSCLLSTSVLTLSRGIVVMATSISLAISSNLWLVC